MFLICKKTWIYVLHCVTTIISHGLSIKKIKNTYNRLLLYHNMHLFLRIILHISYYTFHELVLTLTQNHTF